MEDEFDRIEREFDAAERQVRRRRARPLGAGRIDDG
jgi:hypothetical protein